MTRILGHILAVTTLFCVQVKSEALSNVSFSDVMALSYEAPAKRDAYGNSPYQVIDRWVPHNAPRAHVIVVHGGCWLSEYDVRHVYPMATELAQQGYIVSAVEYRRTGVTGGGWPNSLDDINAAINYLTDRENKMNLPVVLIGHSAGGHLALLASRDNESSINLTIGLAPITDLTTYAKGSNSCQLAAETFMGGAPQELPDLYFEANPSSYDVPSNLLILNGREDQIVPYLEVLKYSSDSMIIDKAGHFDVIHPGTDAWIKLMSSLDSWLTTHKETIDD